VSHPCVTETRGIDPRIFAEGGDGLSSTIQSVLISLVDRTQPARSLVRFIFVDEGLLTVTRFERFLSSLDPLLRAVGCFELIYVAASDHNFREAAALVRRQFLARAERQQQSLHPAWQRSAERNPPQPASPLRPQFTTLLLRFSYPSLQRNEPRCSVGCSAVVSEVTR
jgi:hypothetical protein